MKILTTSIFISCLLIIFVSCGDGEENEVSSSQSFNTEFESVQYFDCEFPESLPTMFEGADNFELLEIREMNQREIDLWFYTSDCLVERGLIREELNECIEMPKMAFVDGLNPNNNFTCSKNNNARGCHRKDVVMVEESIIDFDDVYIHEFCHRFCGVEMKDRTHFNDCFVFDEDRYNKTGKETYDCVCEYEVINQ